MRLPLRAERITLSLVLPVLLSLVAAMLLVVWLIERSAQGLDAEAELGDHRLARTLIERQLESVEQLTFDYAWWDAAHTHLATTPNSFWADENIGWYWHEIFGVSASFVVSATGETVFGFVDGERSEVSAEDHLGDALVLLVRQARAAAGEEPGSAAAVVEAGERLVLVAASTITPELVEPGFPASTPRSVLLAVRDLDAEFLETASRDFRLGGIALQAADVPVPAGRTAHPLPGPDGSPAALMTWLPNRPGAGLRESLLLPVAGVGLLVLGLFGLFVWISHSVADRLYAAKVAAESASRAKSRFLANVSHELRTPLNAILGFSEMIKLGQVPSNDRARHVEYGAAIHQSGTHLLNLIEDLLDLTKIEGGRQALKLEWLDAEALLAETQGGLAPLLSTHGHDVSLELPTEPLPLVADRRAVRQILYNLLNNAAKFTPDGGKIVMGAALRPGEGVELFVRDNGIGIDRDDLERVRRPFEQVAQPEHGATGGTGLGLSIVEGLARAHGGELRLASRRGEGTHAAVVFPLTRGDSSKEGSDRRVVSLPVGDVGFFKSSL